MDGQQTNRAGGAAATATFGTQAEPGDARLRSLTLATERELRSPLRALRLLLEGRRGTLTALTERAFADRDLIDRALRELGRAERAAADLVQWTAPRETRAVRCTLGEIVDSLAASLDRDVRARCHFVVEDADARLLTDGRLVAESFSRTIEDLIDPSRHDSNEAMVHAHADESLATISLVEGASEGASEIDLEAVDLTPTLAEVLLERDLSEMGARVSLHGTGGHRCCVVVLPRSDAGAGSDGLGAYGGAA
jgi:hypothetical protein